MSHCTNYVPAVIDMPETEIVLQMTPVVKQSLMEPLPSSSETLSEMPPPPPSVHLLPPTPNTSQEAANYTPTTLLDVPVTTSPAPPSPKSRPRSPTPVGDLHHSPHLASPSPGGSQKCQATDDLDEPAVKKLKE